MASTEFTFKHPRVTFRKLGRERAWGYYDGKICLDSRLSGKHLLEIMIHEYLHHLGPEKCEEAVLDESKRICDFLWKRGYRRVDQ